MITIHKPADVQLTVIDGDPPIDQSAQVAALQAQVDTLTGERDVALALAQTLADKINAAKTALA